MLDGNSHKTLQPHEHLVSWRSCWIMYGTIGGISISCLFSIVVRMFFDKSAEHDVQCDFLCDITSFGS